MIHGRARILKQGSRGPVDHLHSRVRVQDAQTKPDYIAKMAVSRKESRETLYWLRLAIRAGRER